MIRHARHLFAILVTATLAPFVGPVAWAQISTNVPGTVYLVVGSDTAIWNVPGTVDVYTRHPHYSQASFTDTNAPIFQVMDPAWRNQFHDSFGQAIKFTWWMMGGNIYRDADNLNVPVPNTMTLHLMRQYHGESLRQFGDELSLHYHTFLWSDYNGTGVHFWNQSRTFNECRADFDVTLSQYLLEEGVFPVSFRSGWHFMDQDWQAYLNQLIPFSFHDNFGAKVAWYTNAGPVGGVEDWSHAPSDFVPFHPSAADYQVPGDTPGWNVRSVKLQALSQALVDQIFAQASNGMDQVACLWTHLPENFTANVTKLGGLLTVAATKTPSVAFRYCTAAEAMQRWLRVSNPVPPVLAVEQDNSVEKLTLRISTDRLIFQPRPFVCLRDVYGNYQNVTGDCVSAGTNTWVLTLPVPVNRLAKVAVAVSDPYGSLATKIIQFLPDDLYLDDRDAQYQELAGNWLSSTNYAWGTDARASFLNSNGIARVSWALPIAWSGRYRISAQVPVFTNAATNVTFSIYAAGSNLLSVLMPAGIPPGQWAFVGSVPLEAGASNRVEMSVIGDGQVGSWAVADVLRVVPAPESDWPSVDSASALEFLPSHGGYLLRFEGQSLHVYLLQRAGQVQGPWATLQRIIPSANGLLEYQDEKPPTGDAFYRVLAE